jgi:hypothetical protein
MFTKFIIKSKLDRFDPLSNSTTFDNIVNGRKGATLIDYKNNIIPLVRTTTKYKNHPQPFLHIHREIIENIKNITKNGKLYFNNALIEIYDQSYFKMGYHSDQSLDLDPDSYICIFSCYDDPMTKDLRTLKIKNKSSNEQFDITMEHNSIILFSVETNQKYLHKIVLESQNANNLWLGVTFRQSKTFITFINQIPYFCPNKIIYFDQNKQIGDQNEQMVLADEIQQKEFYKHRGLENSTIVYIYPEIKYTLSQGDLMPPEDFNSLMPPEDFNYLMPPED